jgi:Flp pilus assembly protein TadG
MKRACKPIRRLRYRIDRDERGYTAILTLLIFGFVIVIGLIAVNTAVMFAARVSVQRAADAAVLAACLELPNSASAETFAQQYGSSAGGLNAAGSASLESGRGDQTVATAVDSSGAVSARSGSALTNDRVQVDVSRTQDLIGLPAAGFTDRGVPARATCSRDEGSFPALLALGGGSGTLRIDAANVNLPRTGVVANSTDPSALQVSAGGSATAKFIETGSGDASGGPINPPPSTGTYADPYAGVGDPPLSGSSADPCPFGTTTTTPSLRCFIDGGTASEGIYWGGLRLRGNVTLNAGTYHIAGGDLSIDAGAVISGTGVTFFIGPNDLGTCGASHLHADDNARLQITPPSGGSLRDLIIFQSRSCTRLVEFHPGVQIGRPGGPYGAIYAPTAQVLIGGGTATSTAVNAIVVASRIRVWGPASFPDIFIPSGDVRHGDMHLVE